MSDVTITVDECEEMVESPGKFEGCARYIPYFHELMLDGGADDEEWDDDENNETVTYVFAVRDEDVELFSELKDIEFVRFFEDDDGFVREVK